MAMLELAWYDSMEINSIADVFFGNYLIKPSDLSLLIATLSTTVFFQVEDFCIEQLSASLSFDPISIGIIVWF